MSNNLQFTSHSTCFSCLLQPSEHPLPCGHVICSPCLRALGTARGKSAIHIKQCPLPHVEGGTFDWHVQVMPLAAGPRILTLDGGGVRGIVELEILRHLEIALKPMALQAFFDLMVGTSAGGIVALGLGVENMRVETCLEEFERVCADGFVLRKMAGVWGFRTLTGIRHNSIYETKPLQRTLQEVFGDDFLFGGGRSSGSSNHYTKVALISTSAAGMRKSRVLLRCSQGSSYYLTHTSSPFALALLRCTHLIFNHELRVCDLFNLHRAACSPPDAWLDLFMSDVWYTGESC